MSLVGLRFAVFLSIALMNGVGAVALLALDKSPTVQHETILVGAKTEERFPPLQVPNGFKPTLFACDPLIEYPSVISIGPRPDTLFLAHDYVTGLGIEIVRRDEVRVIQDSDGDGYADRSTVYAKGFNSIQGLSFYDGNVFVMHAPHLTRLRDTDGDDVADERRDLITGLGLPPEENSNRLHCANGVVAGHDGWLYLALGDRGCDVQRPEGDRLLFQQGGILRCRSDGSDLHVFSTGLRNIYDVALDEHLNVFVRDNENDGGDYMIRVCHCFFGSDHGYPYHYRERPGELMQPLADLGRGSSAGGTSYLETAFPQEFRESLFFCEWGRAIVRYPQAAAGSSFQPMQEIDFAAGAPNDPYGFKPTDLVVGYDGSLFISDWCDGQRPKRGRGRIYRVDYVGENASKRPSDSLPAAPDEEATPDLAMLIRQLDSPSYHQRVAAQLELQKRGDAGRTAVQQQLKAGRCGVRARLHAVWVIALSGSDTAIEDLFTLAETDPDAGIRAQAVRAIGDLASPVLTQNRVDAGRGDVRIARRIATLAENNSDPRVLLESLVVMRRLQWSGSAAWIASQLRHEDHALNHAAVQALRNSDNWPAVAKLLDESPRLRRLALQAMAEQRLPVLADELRTRLQNAQNLQRRMEYVDTVARIVRQEKPWEYWGFRPAPRPAASIDWAKTADITSALNRVLADDDLPLRAFTLERMLREGVAVEPDRLADWLRQDTDEKRVAAVLTAINGLGLKESHSLLLETVRRQNLPTPNRLSALQTLIKSLSTESIADLAQLASDVEDGPVLAAVLRDFGARPKLDIDSILLNKLASAESEVRAESIRALGRRGAVSARNHLADLLQDESIDVQQAAAESAGRLQAEDVRDALLKFATSEHTGLARASLASLRQLKDTRAELAAVAALKHRDVQITALSYLKDIGTPAHVGQIMKTANGNLSSELQRESASTLVAWRQRFPGSTEEIEQAVAAIQGRSGQLLAWQTFGPLTASEAEPWLKQLTSHNASDSAVPQFGPVRTVVASGDNGEVRLSRPADSSGKDAWLAWTSIRVDAPTDVEIRSSAAGEFFIWLNNTRVHARPKAAGFRADSDSFATQLPVGTSRLTVKVVSSDSAARFHVRFRRRSSKAEHERLIAYALQSRGNPDRGRDIFKQAEKSLCVKCHRLGAAGGRVGPDLTGIGSRFSRIHLIESILEPSRSVGSGYVTIVVVRDTGSVVSGIRVSENVDTLVVGDNEGKLHEIPKSSIDQIAVKQVSTMPEGLEKKLTDREFADLLAFLESQKKTAAN